LIKLFWNYHGSTFAKADKILLFSDKNYFNTNKIANFLQVEARIKDLEKDYQMKREALQHRERSAVQRLQHQREVYFSLCSMLRRFRFFI